MQDGKSRGNVILRPAVVVGRLAVAAAAVAAVAGVAAAKRAAARRGIPARPENVGWSARRPEGARWLGTAPCLTPEACGMAKTESIFSPCHALLPTRAVSH